MFIRQPSSIPSAAAAAVVSQSSSSGFFDEPPLLSGPTLRAAKSQLSAVPAGLVSSMASRYGKSRGRAKTSRTVQRLYNEIAGRPHPRNGISLEQTIQLEMQYTGLFTTTSASGVPVGAAQAFRISDFSGAINLLATFDQYRMDQAEVWIEPQAAMGTTAFGIVTTAIDLDDASAPGAVASLQDHPGAIQSTGGSGHYHKFAPHMAVAVYSGAFTSFANEPAGWIDAASNNVQHFGIKMLTNGFTTAVPYNITIRCVFSLRAPVIV